MPNPFRITSDLFDTGEVKNFRYDVKDIQPYYEIRILKEIEALRDFISEMRI